jgi:geranylgeranyl pyrophosphate synthase
VTDAGGLEYARRQARRYATLAEEALDGIPEDGDAMAAMREAIGYAVERSS